MPSGPIRLVWRPQRFLRTIAVLGPKRVTAEIRAGMRDVGREFVQKFAARRLRGRTGRDRVAVRTGALRRSFGFAVRGQRLSQLRLDAGFGPPAHPWSGGADRYARVHVGEPGDPPTTITPKRGKFLAIPVGAGLTRAGVARFRSPRDLPGRAVFIRRAPGKAPGETGAAGAKKTTLQQLSQSRPVFLPRRAGPGWVILFGGRIVFVLVRRVRIRKRIRLKGAAEAATPRMKKTLQKRLDEAARSLRRGS